MPAVAGEQRQRVDHDEAVDAIRHPRREPQRRRAPVVDDEVDALEAEPVQEALDVAVIAGERVGEGDGLDRVAEARQVGRDATGEREEWRPHDRAVGNPVHVEDGRSVAGRRVPGDRHAVDLVLMALDVRHPDARG
jgi:hypothetical protein